MTHKNEFLIASKSILQTPVKHRKGSYIIINSRFNINSAEG